MTEPGSRLPLLIRLYQQYLSDEDAARFIGDVSKRYTTGTLVRLAAYGDRVHRRAAVMAIAFLGDYSHNAVLGRALQDDDRVVRLLSEDGIRGIWKRDGSEQDQQALQRIERLSYAEQWQSAVAAATELIERLPSLAEAWNQRAVAYFHLKRFRVSANDCHQSLELNPYHFAAAVGMGHCHLEMNDAFAALECFRRALRINPDLEGVRAQVQYLERTLEGHVRAVAWLTRPVSATIRPQRPSPIVFAHCNRMDVTRSQVSLQDPVLVLGAGINGAAVARELLLNDVPVVLVDVADISSGTTSYSSRLIHGGLRYLEYAEFRLVKESLHERSRLLEQAPHLVQPLRLFIPVNRRMSGLLQAAWRFFGGKIKSPKPRGLFVVRLGLRFYDWISRKGVLPRSRRQRWGDDGVPAMKQEVCRWACSYSDAQVRFPERFVMSLLHDAQRIAHERQLDFRLLTYQTTVRDGRQFRFTSQQGEVRLNPSVVINATGPWGDRTLSQLEVKSQRLIGGTKGSHLVTFHSGLRVALGGNGVYTEAADGRPVFVLPFGDSTLIGTTDIHFRGDPRAAVADDEEIEYLLDTVNQLFDVHMTRIDVDQHYCGVRPLPFVDASTPAATTRQHSIIAADEEGLPIYSIVGGKLTTCRSLAEDVVARVFSDLDSEVPANSRERDLAGAAKQDERDAVYDQLAGQGWSKDAIDAGWDLLGELSSVALDSAGSKTLLKDTNLPLALVDWVIQNESVQTLADLVERRLMLHFHRRLSRMTLVELADRLVQHKLLDSSQQDAVIDEYAEGLLQRFGKRLV